MIRAAALLAACGLLAACPDANTVRVTVERAGSGETILSVDAEVARTADERRTGLRGHAALADGEGLLIEMPQPLDICIVNDGVDFPIDAIYAGAAGTVIAIERTIPAGDPTARCQPAVRWVLELSAGAAAPVSPNDHLTPG